MIIWYYGRKDALTPFNANWPVLQPKGRTISRGGWVVGFQLISYIVLTRSLCFPVYIYGPFSELCVAHCKRNKNVCFFDLQHIYLLKLIKINKYVFYQFLQLISCRSWFVKKENLFTAPLIVSFFLSLFPRDNAIWQ